jgi:hypothetical protein
MVGQQQRQVFRLAGFVNPRLRRRAVQEVE